MESTPLLRYQQDEYENPFSDKAVRNGFVRKVFTLLSVQLLLTCGVVAAFFLAPGVASYAVAHPSLLWSAVICYVALVFVLACCPGVQRAFPWNILALFAITLALAYLVGVVSVSFTAQSVLLALAICVVCCVAVTLFAAFTSYDFTSLYGWLFLASTLLLLVGLLFMPFVQVDIWQKVYAGVGAAIFMLYLAADTQMILGRKGLALSAEDYVFATLTIYLDVINIFLFLLQIVGERK